MLSTIKPVKRSASGDRSRRPGRHTQEIELGVVSGEGDDEIGERVAVVEEQAEPRGVVGAAVGEDVLVASCLAAAAQGDLSAYFDLGIAYANGSHGAACDRVEAHKWFNLAAVAGHEEAQIGRADIAEEMSAREIAEAQRRAREWLAASSRPI